MRVRNFLLILSCFFLTSICVACNEPVGDSDEQSIAATTLSNLSFEDSELSSYDIFVVLKAGESAKNKEYNINDFPEVKASKLVEGALKEPNKDERRGFLIYLEEQNHDNLLSSMNSLINNKLIYDLSPNYWNTKRYYSYLYDENITLQNIDLIFDTDNYQDDCVMVLTRWQFNKELEKSDIPELQLSHIELRYRGSSSAVVPDCWRKYYYLYLLEPSKDNVRNAIYILANSKIIYIAGIVRTTN